MKIKLTLISALCFFLFGCGGDKYESYIGLWKMVDSSTPKIAKIYKDGETYLFDENILNKNKPMVLKRADNQLSIENGFIRVTLGISADGKTLHVANQEYTKINEEKLNEIKSTIEKEKLEEQKNKELCKALGEKYKQEKRIITERKYDFLEENKKLVELNKKFEEQSKSIPRCIPFLW